MENYKKLEFNLYDVQANPDTFYTYVLIINISLTIFIDKGIIEYKHGV